MKFNRTNLIEELKRIRASHQKMREQHDAARLKEYAEAHARYLREYNPYWSETADVINKALEQGVPITLDMLPPQLFDRGGYARVFQLSAPDQREVGASDLDNAISLLESAVDDEVTDVSLQRMGIRVSRWLNKRAV